MSALKATLFGFGAVVEFLGILGIAAPDLVPYGERLSRWLGRRSRQAANRIRRLLGRPPRAVIHAASISGGLRLEGQASAVTGVAEDAPLEAKVDFLLRRDQEAQRHENEISRRLADFERESGERLDALREEIEDHFARDLAAALSAYRPIRALGAVALAIGLGMVTAANFVG